MSHVESVSLPQYLYNLTMLPSNFAASLVDGSYWTLRIELKFYLVVAVILILRTVISISMEKLALILTVPLLYNTLFYNPFSYEYFNNLFSIIFNSYGEEYAQYFMAGILFYAIYKNSKKYYSYVALALCYLVAILQGVNHTPLDAEPHVVSLYITLFFGLFLIISLRKINNPSFSFFGKHYRKVLITLGAITYPLYLLHNKITEILLELFSKHGLGALIVITLVFLIITLLTLAVNRFDIYINILWKKFFTRKKYKNKL